MLALPDPTAWLAAALALLAAALFAVASAVQHRSASQVPVDQGGSLRLVRSLLRSPRWWTGTLADAAGYGAQAAALGLGSLLLVQPLLVTAVLFALPLSARWAGRRLAWSDWAWAAVLVTTLALFVVTGEPTAGSDTAGWRSWLPAVAVLGVVTTGCLVGAAVHRGTPRAVLLALTTGVAAGLAAALTKGVVGLLDDGLPALLGSWTTYALAGSLLAATVVQQLAFQAGPLQASLPAATVGEPVVAAALGITVLGERLRAGGAEWLLVVVLVAAMVAATVALARSTAALEGPPGSDRTDPVRAGAVGAP